MIHRILLLLCVFVLLACVPTNDAASSANVGGFSSTRFVPIIDHGTDNALQAIPGDYDGDGIPDLMLTSYNIDSYVFHKGLGGGQMGPKQVAGVSYRPSRGVACDVDGDGHLDFVGHSWYNVHKHSVDFVRNKGTNPITWELIKVYSYADDGGHVTNVKCEDLNGDGLMELIVGDSTRGVKVLRNTGTVGAASFVEHTINNILPYGVAVVDMDGDGWKDVVAAVPAASGMYWMKNQFNPDIYTVLGLGVPQHFGTINLAREVEVADFNQDGQMDLAVMGTSTVQVMLLNGAGGSTSQHTVTTANVGYASNMCGNIIIGDYNNDGIPDIATSSRNEYVIQYMVNTGLGQTWGTNNIVSSGIYTLYTGGGDLNQDGYDDLVSPSCSDSVYSHVRFFPNYVPSTSFTRNTLASGQRFISTAVGHFNPSSDLDKDVVYSVYDVRKLKYRLRNPVTKALNGEITLETINNGQVFVFDLDGDTIDDLVWIGHYNNLFKPRLYKGKGDGTFQILGALPTTGVAAVQVGQADFDGVNGLDLYLSKINGAEYCLNNGQSPPSFTCTALPTAEVIYGMTVVDFDNDGAPDIVVGEKDNDRIRVFKNKLATGEGFTTLDTVVDAVALNNPIRLWAGDVNGDGHDDILVSAPDVVTVLFNYGTGSFLNTPKVSYIQLIKFQFTPVSTNQHYGMFADLDMDGDIDIIGCSRGVSLAFWMENLDGSGMSWGPREDLPIPSTHYPIDCQVGSYTDLDNDLFITSYEGYAIYHYENNANVESLPNTDASLPLYRDSIGQACPVGTYSHDCECVIPGEGDITASPVTMDYQASAINARTRVENGQLIVVFHEPVQYKYLTHVRPEIAFLNSDGTERADAWNRCYKLFSWTVTEPEAGVSNTCERTWTGTANLHTSVDGLNGCPFTEVISSSEAALTFQMTVKNYKQVEKQIGGGVGTGEYTLREVTHLLPFQLVFPRTIEVNTGDVTVFSDAVVVRATVSQVTSQTGNPSDFVTSTRVGVYTSVQYPFQLTNPVIAGPSVDWTISAFTIDDSANTANGYSCVDDGSECDRQYYFTISPPTGTYSFTGTFVINADLTCVDNYGLECPFAGETASISISLVSPADNRPVLKDTADFSDNYLDLYTASDYSVASKTTNVVEGQKVYLEVGFRSGEVKIQSAALNKFTVSGTTLSGDQVLYDLGAATATGTNVNMVAFGSAVGTTDPTSATSYMTVRLNFDLLPSFLQIPTRTTSGFTFDAVVDITYEAVFESLSGPVSTMKTESMRARMKVPRSDESEQERHQALGLLSNHLSVKSDLSIQSTEAAERTDEANTPSLTTASNMVFIGVCAVSLVAVLVAVVTLYKRRQE